MSDRASDAKRFIRSSRVAGLVTLGVDGRPREAGDPLSGMPGGSPEETAAATSIVDEARRRADDLVRHAAVDATGIREQARREGFADGYARGVGAAQNELAAALALVQRVAGDAKSIRDDLLRRSEHDMIDLVVSALRAVLGEGALDHAAIVRETVHRAIERAGAQNVVRVRVHPDETQGVTAAMTEATGSPPPYEILADGSIGLGGCVIDTRHGRVDARLDTQIDAIATILRDALPPMNEEVADGD